MNLIESSQHAEIYYSHFMEKDTKTQEVRQHICCMHLVSSRSGLRALALWQIKYLWNIHEEVSVVLLLFCHIIY